MNREQKAAVVEELTEQIRSAEAIFAVDYRGISVSDAAGLRTRLREADTRFRVVKNSLTERATDQAGADQLKAMLEGPTALAFVAGDAALAAKALSDAARSLGTLGFKGGMMNGNALTAEEVQSIARLPARDVLHGQLVGTIAAPLTQLVRTLNALISGLAVQLQQVAEQGLVGGEAPAEAPAAEGDAGAAEADAGAAEGDAGEAEADAGEAPAETAEEPAPDTQDGPVEPAAEADAPESAPEADAPVSAPEADAPVSAPEADAPVSAPEADAPESAETPTEPTDTEASDAEASE